MSDPHRGITLKTSENGITVVRLHYSADEAKNQAWIDANKPKAPSEEWWNQEQEIDFGARQGSRVYHAYKDDDTQLIKPFEVPHEWTRYFVLDTHPRKPHAMIWAAMSPDGYCYVYRELWPSKICGTNKNIPEDDNNYPIKWYCEAVKWLESKENSENHGQDEKIHQRIIDYAARAFGKDRDNPDAVDYQERYETYSKDIGHAMYFEDCIKDNDANYAEVNEWLRPKPVMGSDGNIVMRSKLRIFSTLTELRWELINNRIRMLAPHQVDTRDPEMRIIDKRNDCTDNLKYLVAHQPEFYKPTKRRNTWKPAYEGINF